jgi:uncharacterized protein
MKAYPKKIALAVSLFMAVTAQANVFKSYNDDGALFRLNLNSQFNSGVAEHLDKKIKTKDASLYLLEKARLLQVQNNFEASADTYKKAFEVLDQQNNRAKISASKLGFKALSLVSNDSVVPYDIPRYEQVLAHISQAKNYVALNNAEAAGVEMRVAQRIQREIEQDHAKEFEKAQKNKKTTEDEKKNNALLDEAFNGLDPIAGRVKNTYQNAYAFYMAANLWEALGEFNDALVDYKKSYELQPDPTIAEDVKRLDRISAKNSATVPVVFFIEQGIVPQKIENKIDIPLPNGLVNFAFATYEPSTYVAPQTLKVQFKGVKKPLESYVLNDIGALAVKELKEKTMSNITSQIMRSTAKYAVQQEVGNRLGVFGQIAGNLLNAATERADLRAWSTLPSNTQIVRTELKPGTHEFQIVGQRISTDPIALNVQAGQTVFVYVNDVNEKITTNIATVKH